MDPVTPHGKFNRTRHPFLANTRDSGSNYVQGSLNWGPTHDLNGVSNSYSWWMERRKQFNTDFHTYTLEWTEDFLYAFSLSRSLFLADAELT